MYIEESARENKQANNNKHNKTIAKAAKLAVFHLDKTFLFQAHDWWGMSESQVPMDQGSSFGVSS